MDAHDKRIRSGVSHSRCGSSGESAVNSERIRTKVNPDDRHKEIENSNFH